eukprot:9807921-Lingulodinium_polyedra.AAC.1
MARVGTSLGARRQWCVVKQCVFCATRCSNFGRVQSVFASRARHCALRLPRSVCGGQECVPTS